MSHRTFIGVDLDGTLAYYDKWKGIEHIGDPIPRMMERVRKWLKDGEEVVIFTARITPFPGEPEGTREIAAGIIQDWLEKHGLPRLRVTNIKEQAMRELWDDRAIHVVPNTGIIGYHNPAYFDT